MRKSLVSLMFLAVVTVLAAGCGGGGGGSSSGGGGGVQAADSAKLANCLNNQDWIASPTGDEVSGNSASGGGIDIHTYHSDALAKAAAAKKPKKSTAVVGTSVVQFLGTPSATGPALAAPVNKADLATIKTCIAQSA